MSHLPSIPTYFDGHRFRSRMEARWAVAFKQLGITYWYEPDGFNLGETCYLPDFFLPQIDTYAEVKPYALTPVERLKAERLCLATRKRILLLVGPPDFMTYEFWWPDQEGDCYTVDDALLDIYAHGRAYYDDERRLFTSCGGAFQTEEEFSPEYRNAVFASRFACFEGAA